MQLLQTNASRIIRRLIYENWEPSRVEGYDVTQSDPSQDDFLPLTTDFYAFGDTYPSVTITNFAGLTQGGGVTGYTGLQGDGSGLNKQQENNGLLTIQAEDEETYLNGTDAEDILLILANHIEQILQENADGNLTDKNGNPIQFGARPYNGNYPYGGGTYSIANEFFYVGFEEQDVIADTQSDRALFQKQYEISLGWLNEP
jgi:hypothetical protein